MTRNLNMGDSIRFSPEPQQQPAEAMTRESHPLAVATRPDDGAVTPHSAGEGFSKGKPGNGSGGVTLW